MQRVRSMPNEQHDPNLSDEQRRALESTVGAIHEIAMKLVELPKENRHEQYAIVRRNFREAFARAGMPGEASEAWLDGAMKALETLVSEIEVSGISSGGHA